MGSSYTWGTTESERRLDFPCDAYLPGADLLLYRGVSIDAPPADVFRWLCQLRAAPYSYDWIDNWGRRSPQELTPGLEKLEVGQQVMTIFELLEFETDRQLTLRIYPGSRAERLFGRLVISYLVKPRRAASVRLLAKLRVQPADSVLGWLGRRLLPAGDMIMMRRQLLNLKRLAERDGAARRETNAQ